MNSKELVYRAIEFRKPCRLPIYYFNRDFEFSDVIGIDFRSAKGFDSQSGITEWGYKMHSLDNTMGQPEDSPLKDPNAIDTYIPPDPYAPGRFDNIDCQIANHSNRFLKFGLGITGFNQATFLRGFEEFLTDLYTDMPRAERVLDIVYGFENGIIDQATRFDIDAISFADDWGTQRALMISPNMWRNVFKPRYKEQFDFIHDAGKKVWFHSCGYVYDIIEDLIEIGVDVIELLQPDLLGVENLARDFGGRICFCCSVDHQRRAISGTREELLSYAEYLYNTLGKYNGGLIGYIEDYSSLGMSEENYQFIRQALEACKCIEIQGHSNEIRPC